MSHHVCCIAARARSERVERGDHQRVHACVSDTTPQDRTPLEIALARVAEVERENAELRAKLVAMEQQIRRLLRRYAATTSETLIHDCGQQPIPEIAAAAAHLRSEGAAAGVAAEVAAVTAPADGAQPKRRQPRARGRLTLPAHLETVEDRITLPPAELIDADGTPLVPVGTERSERLDWEPGRFLRRVTIRTRYGRKDSREAVVTAPVPPVIVARGLGADGLVLHIAHQKYGLGVPLHRQRGDWLRHGVDLSTQTACSWMGHLSRRLASVVGAIRQQILSEPILHLDDTPLKRWTGERRGSCHIARIWCYTAADQVFFDFTDSRAGHWPGDVLRGYRGHIVADAYAGHDALFAGSGGEATEVGCWAHVRRPFHELHRRSSAAREQLELIQALYRIDDVAAIVADSLGTDAATQRTRLRASEAPALLAAIRARADAIVATEPEQSELAQAARYLRNHWDALVRFVGDGRLPLDNNAAERQQRPIATGRKNWLFVASEDGGTWAADLLTVFQSCRLQRIDPIAYLRVIMPDLIAGDVDPLRLTPAAYATGRRVAA
jgi:transposase